MEYVKEVKAWTDIHKAEFEKLQLELQSATVGGINTPLEKVVGKRYGEIDIEIALGRVTNQTRTKSHYGKRDENLERDFAGSKRRRLADEESGLADVADEDLVIDYIPVKFEKIFKPDKNSAFLPAITSTEYKKHFATVKIAYAYDSAQADAGTWALRNTFEQEVALLGHRE